MTVRESYTAGYIVAGLLTGLAGLGAPVQAQEAGESTEVNRNTEIGVSVTEIYDDNIFATRNDKETDFITLISPFLRAETSGESASFRLDAGATAGRYASNETENYNFETK